MKAQAVIASAIVALLLCAGCGIEWVRDARCTPIKDPFPRTDFPRVEVTPEMLVGRWCPDYNYEDGSLLKCSLSRGCPDENIYRLAADGEFIISRWTHEPSTESWAMFPEALTWDLQGSRSDPEGNFGILLADGQAWYKASISEREPVAGLDVFSVDPSLPGAEVIITGLVGWTKVECREPLP